MQTDIVETTVLGLSLRGPRHEVDEVRRRLAELQAQAATVPDLLTRLDQVERKNARIEKELSAIRLAATAASDLLVGRRRERRCRVHTLDRGTA